MVLSLKEKIDYYVEFKDWYQRIIKDFKFDTKKDDDARDLLSEILSKKENNSSLEQILISFKDVIQSRSLIFIYGCGPSLENTIENIMRSKEKKIFNEYINLAADGASVYLKEKGIPLHGIFTDLDGITKNEFNYADFMFIHAHGDNIAELREFEKEILNSKNIIGTTQVEPLDNMINAGGFTDGDRILYFLRSLLSPDQILFLIGMDFGRTIGKYSKPEITNDEIGDSIKIKKLQYALELIEWFQKRIKNKIYIVNSKPISAKLKYISIKEFLELIC